MTAVVTADGRTEYAYDALGNVVSVTDALANTTHYEYNESSELTAVQYANGARVEACYDLNGNAVSETDAMGNITRYTYDAADRLTAVTDALGNTTRYEYDLRDNISAVTDALDHTVYYAYDAAGRLITETDAPGNVTAYEYTKEGWVSRITKPDGSYVSCAYDRNGELTEETYSDGRIVSYEYNELGRLTVTEGADGRTEYQYDGRGYLISILYPNGEQVGYEYDDRGSRTALIYPDGSEVRYSYDELGRMTSVTGLDGSVTRYEYDALGRRILTAGGSLTTEYEYDAVGSVVRMATTGETGLELLYSYDLNGMLTSETRSENGVSTVSEYAYDALNRVSAFTNGSQSESFSYDAVGNMLEKLANGTEISMTYDAANRMTGMSSENGSISYSYSANGDLISKAMGELRDTYTYDAAGNLTRYNGYDGYEVKYTYSALNLLTEKVSKGSGDRATLEEIVSGKGSANTAAGKETVTTRYTYDILQTYANVLTETANGETTSYEYGLERIAAYTGTDAEQVKTQYVYDVRGSVLETITARALRELSEATAAPTVTVQGYAYTPYGEQIGTAVSGYTYNGEYYDAATGMLNLRARQYEPAQMRFSQPDIVRGYAVDPQSINRYAYCVNNPVMYADPSGMLFETVTNLWNAAKESAVGQLIDNIVQPIVKTVSTCIGVARTAINAVSDALFGSAKEKWRILKEAREEANKLDKNDPLYVAKFDLLAKKTCAKLEGADDAVRMYEEQMQDLEDTDLEGFNLKRNEIKQAELDWLQLSDVWGTLPYDQRVYVLSIEHNYIFNDGKGLTGQDLIEAGIESQDSSKFWLNQRAGTFDLSYLGAVDRLNVAFDNYNLINVPIEELRGYYYLEASSMAIAMTKAFLETGNAVPGYDGECPPFNYSGTQYDNQNNSNNNSAINLSGQWMNVNEKMSKLSQQYQSQVTGHSGEAWVQNGVKFDGMKDGTLIDAKGHYSQFINKETGDFYGWFSGREALLEQANKQIIASEGAPIQWFFAEKAPMELVRDYFYNSGITGIDFIYQPLQ